MNQSVIEAFNVFDEHIRLTDEVRNFALNEARKVSRLIGEHPDVKECFTTGSIMRSTAIRRFSDVDIVVVLRGESGAEGVSPRSMLAHVTDITKENLPDVQTTGNTISFVSESGTRIDLLPALEGHISPIGDQIYEISAGSQSHWEEYSPDEQSRRIAELDRSLGPRFKQLIRAIKWWSQANSRPISSHQIEILVSQIFKAGIPQLSQAVVDFFIFVVTRIEENRKDLRQPSDALADLAGIDQGVQDNLHRARHLAKQACELEANVPSHADQAIRIWRRLFGEQFPTILS